jgi:hypothetical protein
MLASLSCVGCYWMFGGAAAVRDDMSESGCYQDLTVTVIDDLTGAKVCDAQVTIRDSNGEMQDLDSCYHASLSEGQYRIRAALAGRKSEATAFEVGDLSDCKPVTSTIVLTIPR